MDTISTGKPDDGGGASSMSSGDILASRIAHEINNVAHAVQANLKILRAMWPTLDGALAASRADGHPSPPAVREALPRILDDMESELRRIAHISSSVKHHARALPEHFAPVDVQAMINAALKSTAHELSGQVEVILDLPAGLPCVSGDEQLLNQVFVNLFLNAAHAMQEVDRPRRLHVAGRLDEAGHVMLSVADTGKGMTAEVLSNLFKPFFTTRRGKGGTGLGLYISREIIRQHKGRLTVQSELGKGALVVVSLPPDGKAKSP